MSEKDVNLIHRLLKNHVAEATGWRAYAMFTDEVLKHIVVMNMTCQLEALPDGRGTRLHARLNGQMPVPGFLNRPAFRFMFTRFFPMKQLFEKMRRRIVEEATSNQQPASEARLTTA